MRLTQDLGFGEYRSGELPRTQKTNGSGRALVGSLPILGGGQELECQQRIVAAGRNRLVIMTF